MRLLCLFLTVLAASGLSGQIDPPEFLCTRSDGSAEVLRWNNVNNGCGTYEATEIYRSTNPDGPFVLAGELTDPAATEYRDENPSGELRYYFLRYRYDCPGETVGTSRTLDSAIPATPIVQYMSLEEGDVILDWMPSVSPEVIGYIVFEVTATAFVPLDTVFGVTDYRFTPAAGAEASGSRSFRLVAVDACGNDSPQGTIVTPMSLSGSGGMGCEGDIILAPATEVLVNYLPSVALELFVSVNGGPFTMTESFPPNATEVRYRDANDGEDLCFYVEAVLADNNGRARSAQYCQTVSFDQPVRDFPLYGVELNDAGEPVLTYADDRVQPATVTSQILVTDAGGQTTIFDINDAVFGTGGSLTVPVPYEMGQTISLRVADGCGREVTTNRVMPVFLEASSLFPGQNRLDWTVFENNLPGGVTYEVERAIVADEGAAAGAMFSLLAVDLTTITFADDVGNIDGIACYRIRARFQPDTSDASSQSFLFRSDISCVMPVTEVFVPTAFSPIARQAENQVFRPLFSNLPQVEGYSFRVFDRWGGLLFETGDPAASWAGDARGKALTAGAYLYQLEYVSSAGFRRQRAGVINLLR